MKIAIATHFPANPETPCGGVEAVSVNLVRALTKIKGLDIHVVTADPTCRKLTISNWEGSKIHRLPGSNSSILAFATGKGRQMISIYLRELAPDVVHAHDTYGIMIKGLSIPRVFTIHGFIHKDTLVSGKKFAWLRSKLWKRVEESAWADQPNIISISPYVREKLSNIITGTIYDIDNPISDCFFDIKADLDQQTIFSAAVIGPRKNPISLIKAMAILRTNGCKAQLRLAGSSTNDNYIISVKKLIKKYQLEDAVCLLGRIKTNEVKNELAKASVFSLVSFEENSPMGIEEAMAAGVPIVTSNRCGMPYMVKHGISGFLVNPFSPEDIARRLQQIIDNKDLREKMSQSSRAIALNRFHPNEVARQTYAVYLEATNRQHKRRS